VQVRASRPEQIQEDGTSVLATSVALVDLAFHTTNPDLILVLFMVGVVMASP